MKLLKNIPEQFRDRIGYGLYGDVPQFFIKGVDGTLAQLGDSLPPLNRLQAIIDSADRQHKELVRHHDRK